MRFFLVAVLVALPLVSTAETRPEHPNASGVSGSTSCDSLCQLFRTMASGRRIRLTNTSNGNFSSAIPKNGCTAFDGAGTVGGMPCSGTGASPWSSSAAALNAVYGGNALGAMTPYSNGGINGNTGKVCFTGGGHVAGLDSGIYCLDTIAGAASRLANGSGANWHLAIAGARYVTYGTSGMPPSWSYQTNGNTRNGLWVVRSVTNQDQVSSAHTYQLMMQATGTNKWIVGGGYFNDGSGGINTNPNAQLIVDDVTQKTYLLNGGKPAPLGAYDMFGRVVYDDASGNVYSWSSGYGAGAFWKIAHPLTAPSISQVMVPGIPNIANYNAYGNDTIMPDPVNPTKQDYVGWNSYSAVNKFGVVLDINGMPSFSGMVTITPYPKLHGNNYLGICSDPDNPGRVYVDDGTGAMARITLVPSDISASTFVADPATIAGDVPALYGSPGAAAYFEVCKVLSSKRPGGGGVVGGFIMTAFGQVYAGRL